MDVQEHFIEIVFGRDFLEPPVSPYRLQGDRLEGPADHSLQGGLLLLGDLSRRPLSVPE